MRRKTRLKKMVTRLCRDEEATDRSFDLSFWSNVSDEGKFTAAWEMVVDAWKMKGKDLRELRFNRSIAVLKYR